MRTPTIVTALLLLAGCPKDPGRLPEGDHDAIIDNIDGCPDVDYPRNGFEEDDGCPDTPPTAIPAFACDGPDFPQPAPRPSSFTVLDLPEAAVTVEDASTWLTGELRRAGYPDPVWFCLKDGVAAMTTLERVETDGRPARPRWSGDEARPSLLDRLLSLVLERPGTWRVLVFAISDAPPRVEAATATAATFNDLDAHGELAPSSVALPAPVAGMKLTVLVYELVQTGDRSPAALRRPGALTTQGHLRAAGLSRVLTP